MASRIQTRRDTAANWTSVNPVLAPGEAGLETDTGLEKIGDGTTAWTSLRYAFSGAYAQSRTALAPTFGGLRKISAYAHYPSFVHIGGKILCVGDSTTQGVGAPTANAVNVGSYPAQLVARLNALGLPAVKGLAIPAAGNGGNYLDSRFSTTGTAWSIPSVNNQPGWANIASYGAPAASSGTLVFDGSGQTVDTFAVYYLAYPGNGTVSCTVNGGAATNISSNAAAGWGVGYVNCTAGTSNVLTINAPTGGSFYVVGVEAVGSQVASVRVGNAGVGGSKAADWTSSPVNSAFASTAGIQLYAPDVTIIMLGINDAIASVTTASWTSSMQSIITAAKASGDVILMSCIQSDPAQNSAAIISAEQAFGQACIGLAQSNGAMFLDLQNRLGTYSKYSALGFNAGGADPGRHLSGIGYSDVALAVAGALTSV